MQGAFIVDWLDLGYERCECLQEYKVSLANSCVDELMHGVTSRKDSCAIGLQGQLIEVKIIYFRKITAWDRHNFHSVVYSRLSSVLRCCHAMPSICGDTGVIA